MSDGEPPEAQHSKEHTGVPMPHRIGAIVAVTAATAAIVIDGAIPTIVLPTIANDLGIPQARAVLAITVYQVLLAIGLFPLAALAERIGLRRMFRAGLALFLGATLLCPFIDSLAMLLVLRITQAAGAAAALCVGSALIRHTYPARILGRGLALNSLTVSIGMTVSPLIGAAMLHIAPWPWTFAAGAPPALLALALSCCLPESERIEGGIDWQAAALWSLTVASFFTASDASILAGNSFARGLCGLLSMTGLALLFRTSLRQNRPLFPADLLSRPVIAISVAGALCAFCASMCVLVLLPFRLAQFHGLSLTASATVLAAWPLTTMIVAPGIGLLSDRLPAWLLGSAGMALAALALAWLVMSAPETGVFALGLRAALIGAGFACYTASNARLLLASAPLSRAAPVGGLIATTRILGQGLGAIVAGLVLQAGLIGQPMALAAPILLAVIGGTLSLIRRPLGRTSG